MENNCLTSFLISKLIDDFFIIKKIHTPKKNKFQKKVVKLETLIKNNTKLNK